MGGQIIDATIVSAPKQQNSRKDNETIKEGETPEEWKSKRPLLKGWRPWPGEAARHAFGLRELSRSSCHLRNRGDFALNDLPRFGLERRSSHHNGKYFSRCPKRIWILIQD